MIIISDNSAIYQQSYAEGFTVAASACLTYLQNILPPSEFAPQAQQFRIGLIQHLQSVMSSHVNGSGEDSTSVTSHLLPSYLPTDFQTQSLLTGSYLARNYLSNLPYPRTPCVAYPPNISAVYDIPLLRTTVSTPSQSNVLSISKDLVSRTVAVVGAQPTLSGFHNNRPEKCTRHSELKIGSETGDKINGLKEVETTKNVKVWRPF